MTRARTPRRRGIVATMIVVGIAATVGGVVAGSASAGARLTGGQPTVRCGAQPTGATVTTAPPADCTLAVTKVVTGTAAPGTTFSVGVDCTPAREDRVDASADAGHTPPFTTTLTFGEKGGAEDVLITEPASCTVTEDSLPPGCTLTSIDPKQPVLVESSEPVNVTVTNDCQVAPTTVPAAQPVPPAPVVAAPLFTG